MAHEAYSPVGYGYQADHYCLDCIPQVIAPNYESVYVQADGCNCTECVLDRIASDRGINRMDESSYDMDTFPKSIPYHNDIHAECQLEESWEPHWSCDAHCGKCGDVIDPDMNGQCPAFDPDALEAALAEDKGETDND